MSADTFRRIANKCRAIPAAFGLREHTVSLILSRTTGTLPWLGDEETTEIPITVSGGQPPKVRFPTQREIALGMSSTGQVTIGPFTPDYGVGGIDRSLFDGTQQSLGDGLLVKITGPQFPQGCLHRIKNSNVDRALRVVLVCIPAEGG